MDDSSYLIIGHISRKDIARIFSKISITPDVQWNGTPCWIWTAYINPKGYGQIAWLGRATRSHRVLYAWAVAPLPIGHPSSNGKLLELDHLCRNRACCNPVHLELVPRLINMERSPLLRTRLTPDCIKGHPFTLENTYWTGPEGKNRSCVQCQRDRNIERYHSKEKNNPEFLSQKAERMKRVRQTPEYRARFAAYMRDRRRAGRDTVRQREVERYASDPVYHAAYNARKREERRKRRAKLKELNP